MPHVGCCYILLHYFLVRFTLVPDWVPEHTAFLERRIDKASILYRCYTVSIMQIQDDALANTDLSGLAQRLQRWAEWIRRSGLTEIAEAVFSATGPFAPLGAHMLWATQPILGLVFPEPEIDVLAQVLTSTQGMAWVHQQLFEQAAQVEHKSLADAVDHRLQGQ